MIFSRSITHDYEQVHNLTDGETDSGMFKNLGYLEQDTKELNTYSQIMRNNEELLASHLRLNTKSGSESGDNESSQHHNLVNTNTHTSQVSLTLENIENLPPTQLNDQLRRPASKNK